jgi:5-methyltetrahydrofolate--homocysteine methyltransferase
MAAYEELQELIITGQKEKVAATIKTLLANGKAPMDIIANGLTAGMDVVGTKFRSRDMFIPEVMMSASAMKEGMDILKPLVVGDSLSFSARKVVIGTVEGDIHTIGKSIVSMLLESSGFKIIDLGINVPAAKFIEAVKKEEPLILGMSAMLTTTMPKMKEVIVSLRESGLRDKTRVMVGGAPITQPFADSIGADGYAPDASSAVEKAKDLIS